MRRRPSSLLHVTNAPVTLGAVRAKARSPERDRFELSPSVGAVSLTPSSVKNVPAFGEPDVMRTVQLLPGVNARNDFSSGYNVRGGESDQNLILLDGYPIYNPFHLGGLFSTFLDETVGSIDLLTGGFGAAYGGRLSSVLDVKTADAERHAASTARSASRCIASSLTIGSASADGALGLDVVGTAHVRRQARGRAERQDASPITSPTRSSAACARWARAICVSRSRRTPARTQLDGDFADVRRFGDRRWRRRDVHVRLGQSGRRRHAARQLARRTRDSRCSARRTASAPSSTCRSRDSRTGLDLADGALTLTNSVHELRAAGNVVGIAARTSGGWATRRLRYGIEYDVSSTVVRGEPLRARAASRRRARSTIRRRGSRRKRLIAEAGLRAEHFSTNDVDRVRRRVSRSSIS